MDEDIVSAFDVASRDKRPFRAKPERGGGGILCEPSWDLPVMRASDMLATSTMTITAACEESVFQVRQQTLLERP